MIGIGRPQLGQAPERFLRDGVPLILLSILSLWGLTLGSSVDALALVCVGACVALAVTALLARRAGYSPSNHWEEGRALQRELRSASLWLMLLAMGQLLISRLGLLLVGYLSGSESAGVYGAVLTLSEVGGFPAQALSLLYAPAIAYAYRHNKSPLITLSIARGVALAMMLPMVLIAVLFGGDILQLLFGPEYELGHFALVALLLTHVARALAIFPQLVLSLIGGERTALRYVCLAMFVEAALVSTLIKVLGTSGAALGTLISTIAIQVLLRRALSRHLKNRMA